MEKKGEKENWKAKDSAPMETKQKNDIVLTLLNEAKKGNAAAMFYLAEIAFCHDEDEEYINDTAAAFLLRRAARLGNKHARERLGLSRNARLRAEIDQMPREDGAFNSFLAFFFAPPRSREEHIDALRAQARARNTQAMFFLQVIADEDDGAGYISEDEAHDWVLTAAESGHLAAIDYLRSDN